MSFKDKNVVYGGIDTLQDITFSQEKQYGREKRTGRVASAFGLFFVTVISGFLLAGLVSPMILPAVAAEKFSMNYWESLPTELPQVAPPQRSQILDANGNQFAEFYSENRVLVPLDQISPNVKNALIATEDAKFYQHSGVDIRGIMRAAVRTSQGDVQGASTITQQLVKNTLVVNAVDREAAAAATDQNANRKIQEIKYAIELEKKYSKDEILNQYLNIVYLANNTYGIAAAASFYFGKSPGDLSVAQAATLVGLLKNPSGYDPIKKPEAAEQRRNVVIGRMLSENYITADEAAAAKAEPLGLSITRPNTGCDVSPYPYYCQWVISTIQNDPAFGATKEDRQATYYRGGLIISTPLDPKIQDDTQRAVDQALGRGNRVASGVAVVQPGTGNVVAMAQNRTFGDSSQDNNNEKFTQVSYPTREAFQSGSTFKVFTLATALEAGYPLDATIDAPGVYTDPNFNTPPGGIKNAAGYDAGLLDLASGTARSSNTFYAELQEKVGVLAVADMAQNLGVNVPREGDNAVGARDASFTLGTISVSPLQMAAAYATFAAGGVYCKPINITAVKNTTGNSLQSPDAGCRQAVSAQTAANVTNILTQVIDGPDPYRTGKAVSLGRPAAGKTGTTNSSSAVWFVGYTPQYATAVWSGDPRGGTKYPLSSGVRLYGRTVSGVAGATVSGPIWRQAMNDIVAPLEPTGFAPPSSNGTAYVIPNVNGMDVPTAVSTLQNAGYSVVISPDMASGTEYSVPDTVASMSPNAGTKLNSAHAIITLTLSAGSQKDWVVPSPADISNNQ